MNSTQELQERMSEIPPGSPAVGRHDPERAGTLRWMVDTMFDTAWVLLDDAVEPGNRVTNERSPDGESGLRSHLVSERLRPSFPDGDTTTPLNSCVDVPGVALRNAPER